MAATIFIDGEAGTTGLQIRDRLHNRRDLNFLQLDNDLRKDSKARKQAINEADIAILCLPDDASREAVAMIENDTTRIIDASSAHRTVDGWTYGFAEMSPGQREAIRNARFVTNPGCYPQGLIALVRPLIEAKLIPADFPVTMNAISGYTGGGKTMIAQYEEGDQSVYWPYGLTMTHKHFPEMEKYSGLTVPPLFQPAVGPYSQGMMSSIPLQLGQLASKTSYRELHACLASRYHGEEFIEIAPLQDNAAIDGLSPEALNGTNMMRLHVFGNEDRGQAILMAIYDNLGKGASGAAVQNMNIMLGTNEADSLALV
ncbi:MAG: N-acetyl-gamma-glutamyl-phosphate reductase [Hyphomicrobiales bacterium]|nr:MAG: N-acetyl-gamma-glutamyl-phosphate reductase [Hyphomicrobiales bacterium]